MPPWDNFEPFIVSGLALGGVYALSGVGLVVLYRATGVLYLAFGAVGALGALVAWSLITRAGAPGWVGWLACIVVAAAVTFGYGLLFGPALAKRDPLVKAVATIGLTLILYGAMDLLWTTSGGQARSLTLPTDNGGFTVGTVQVTWTQVIALGAGVVTLGYGLLFGPALAKRDPLVKAVATLGLTLVLFGVMDLLWTTGGGQSRAITLPTDNGGFTLGQIQVTWTQVVGLGAGVAITVVTAAFLRYTKLGTAMRAMANDREITATLGVPVRWVEAAAWLGCGLLGGLAGLLLADLVALDATTLTFLVISSLAAALIARLRSIALTFVAAIVIGLIHDLLTPIQSLSNYRDMTPFVLAAVALLVLSRRRVISLSREEA